MRVTFLAPELPPAVCGIADHTARLARAMQVDGVEVSFLHHRAQSGETARLPGPVEWWEGGGRSLVRCIDRHQPDWLWVQLSSYGYSRWGAPLLLGRALATLLRVLPDVQVAVCAHETHCLPHQLGRKGRLLSAWQRYTVGEVVRQADLVFTSIARNENRIVQDYGVNPAKVVRLPIGSNVPPANLTRADRERLRQALGWKSQDNVAVTFGSFASQLRALKQCGPCLARGLAQRHLDRVVCLGGEQTVVPREFDRWAKMFTSPGAFTVLGQQPEQTIAEILECCDFAFCPYPRPLLGKSGPFSAFAMAGLGVLVADGGTGDEPGGEELPILPAATWDWSRARSSEILQLRRSLREHALAHYGWQQIAGRALEALQSGPRQPLRPRAAQAVGRKLEAHK